MTMSVKVFQRQVAGLAVVVVLVWSGAEHAQAKTINQVPYSRHAYNVGKLTRGYTLNDPNIQRAMFGVLGAGAAFNSGGTDSSVP